ncbi:MAG: HD domain-containing phosphohydrolase [bacterium]
MTTYCRLTMPVLDVLSIRRAEPGMELETTAFDRNGRPIAEAGEELTGQKIKQLSNLDVRKIVVSSERELWLPEEDVPDNSSVTVLESLEFNEAASDIAESLQSSNTAKALRGTAQFLRQEANQAGDKERTERLTEIINRTYELENRVKTLNERLSDLDEDEDRERLLEALEQSIHELDELYMEVSAPDSLVKSTIDTVDSRTDIQNDLMTYIADNADQLAEAREIEIEPTKAPDASDIVNRLLEEPARGIEDLIEHYSVDSNSSLHNLKTIIRKEQSLKKNLIETISSLDLSLEHRKLLKDVLDGRKTLKRTDLLTLPIPQKVAEKTYKLMQQEIESRTNLWHAADDVLDGTLSQHMDEADFVAGSRRQPETQSNGVKPSSDEAVPEEVGDVDSDVLYKLLDDLESGEPEEGLAQFIREVDGDPRRKGLLAESLSRIRSLTDRRDEISEELRQTLDDPSEIIAMLNGQVSFDPYVLLEYELDKSARKDIAETINELDREYRSIWETVNGLTDNAFYEGTGSNRLDDKINRAKEVVHDSNGTVEEAVGRDYETLLKTKGPHKIASEFDMDIGTVENAQEFMQLPSDLSSEQKLYCDPLIEEMCSIFYAKSFNDDRLVTAAGELADLMVDHNRPLNMIFEPPTGEQYLLSHTINTCLVCLSLANHFSFDTQELLDVTAASLSVDFGMIEIPTQFWTREKTLTDRGNREVRCHPEHSRSIVDQAVNGDRVIQDLVQQHHERPDGSGYPEGLGKGDMHQLAPLIGAADAYTAMLENRPYRSAKTPNEALTILMQNSDTYDSSVVKGLVETIGLYPNGSVVLLSDGRLALVKSQKPSPVKPTVIFLTDKKQNRLDSPRQGTLAETSAQIEKTVKW